MELSPSPSHHQNSTRGIQSDQEILRRESAATGGGDGRGVPVRGGAGGVRQARAARAQAPVRPRQRPPRGPPRRALVHPGRRLRRRRRAAVPPPASPAAAPHAGARAHPGGGPLRNPGRRPRRRRVLPRQPAPRRRRPPARRQARRGPHLPILPPICRAAGEHRFFPYFHLSICANRRGQISSLLVF